MCWLVNTFFVSFHFLVMVMIFFSINGLVSLKVYVLICHFYEWWWNPKDSINMRLLGASLVSVM